MSIIAKAREFLKKYESKIVLLAGFILVAVIAFEAGILKGQEFQQKPIIIEKLAQNEPTQSQLGPENSVKSQNLTQEGQNITTGIKTPDKTCAFVGSKNSNKFHLPSCRWAKQIKPENLVCFGSAEEAAAKSYQPDKNCIK